MKIKKYFSFNEEKDALKIIKNGFPKNKIDYGDMYVIAKYFRQKYNLGKVKLYRILIKFCKNIDKNFNPVLNADSIKKWINSAMNYNLRIIDNVEISKKDIEFLKQIETEKDRKILFIILILTKAFKKGNTKRDFNYKKSNNYYIRYSNFPDIIHLADLKNTTENDIAKILHKYKKYFTLYFPEKKLLGVNFIDKNPEKKIQITDFDNIMDYYYLFFGAKVEKCAICGNEFVKKSNRQKYCEKCSENIKRKQGRERKIKQREREKMSRFRLNL